MFEWLTKGFGYSNAAAYRSIEAAQLLKARPEVEEKLTSGQVNLSTLSKAQSFIKAQEKVSGQKVTEDTKAKVIAQIENKTIEQTEKNLLTLFPETAAAIPQERRKVLDAETTRHSMNLSQQATTDLARAKEVLSHQFPNASDAEIIQYALKFLLDRVDPLRKEEKNRNEEARKEKKNKAGARRIILKNASAQCTFKDPATGKVCGSRYQVQIDHVIPKAFGGTDDPENLRPLCRQHNLLMAERVFGEHFMRQFRSRSLQKFKSTSSQKF
jgi:5-methylcytosine-specific restriction endonuclease McrA